MTSVLLPFAICWSFTIYKVNKIFTSFIEINLLKYLLFFYIYAETYNAIHHHHCYKPGDKEVYSMVATNSRLLLDYSDYIDKNKEKYPEIQNF